jgi:lipopolysaccharide export system protein LptA
MTRLAILGLALAVSVFMGAGVPRGWGAGSTDSSSTPSSSSQAQGAATALQGKSSQPIDIEADQGIEWDRNNKTYSAKGNAKATRGDQTLYGDILVARYREGDNGKSQIFAIEASGSVKMVSPDGTILGQHGIYNLDKHVALVTGGNLRLETKSDVVTARDSLEYYDVQGVAIARGAAKVTQPDRIITADVITAHLTKNAQGKQEITSVEAAGNVVVTSKTNPTDGSPPKTNIARGDSGTYNPKTQIATLTGNVRLTQGDNQVNGQYAEMNTDTGISKVLAAPPGEKGSTRVHGLILPGSAPQPTN